MTVQWLLTAFVMAVAMKMRIYLPWIAQALMTNAVTTVTFYQQVRNIFNYCGILMMAFLVCF